MPVFKSKPSKRIINGLEIETSESSIVTNKSYTTDGEYVIVIKDVDYCELTLNENKTDHVVIKSLSRVLVKTDKLIDDEFNEVELHYGSCVEFKFIGDGWYILSSDGLKNS